MVLISGLLAAFIPAFRPGLETVVGGELGALALYLGGNVGAGFIAAKHTVTNIVQKAEQIEDDAKASEKK